MFLCGCFASVVPLWEHFTSLFRYRVFLWLFKIIKEKKRPFMRFGLCLSVMFYPSLVESWHLVCLWLIFMSLCHRVCPENWASVTGWIKLRFYDFVWIASDYSSVFLAQNQTVFLNHWGWQVKLGSEDFRDAADVPGLVEDTKLQLMSPS